jgi:SagB-type dehydrogenase family enzyme
MNLLPAADYHERTKHSPASMRADSFTLDYDNKPRPYEVYENLPSRPLARSLRPPFVPTLRAVAEPRADPRTGTEDPVPALDLDALTQCLYLSAGVTKTIPRRGREHLFRAAACTGALYHVDLYAVCGAVGDLDAGVYHFDPTTLSADVLREGDHRGVLADAAGGHGRVADAPVTFVATSTWWRNAWKYRERTYRHAFWDSGTVLANLLAVAHALDLPAEVVTGFADRQVADLVGVDPEREAPLELVPVGDGSPAPGPIGVEPIDPETRPLSPEEREYEAIPRAYAGSTLPDGDAARDWRASAPEGGVGIRSPGDGDRVELDPVSDDRAAKTPPYHAIRRRGSCRRYERDALNFRKVSTVLDRAVRGVPMDARRDGDSALKYNDCYLVVNAVEGVDPGAYHYHPDAGDLERLRSGEFRADAGHLALDQALGADAALCAFFLADLDAVTDALGDRGYRVAQLEAAVTAGRLYLAAYAHRDLGATGLTFYDDEVTDFFAPRADGQTPTFCWTLGRPA